MSVLTLKANEVRFGPRADIRRSSACWLPLLCQSFRARDPARPSLFLTDVSAFFSYRTFHEQHYGRQHRR
jgi:hypothetical protein